MLTIPYSFPLRPDLHIKIELPNDLTGREAQRLSAFIQAIAVWAEHESVSVEAHS